jgi:putative NIF3 family GTP cyclohydrolase 1 type 2
LQNLGINFIIVSHQIEEVFIEGIDEFLKDKLDDEVEIILDYKKNYLKIY